MMKAKLLTIFLLLTLFAVPFASQGQTAPKSVLFTIDDKPVFASEFLHMYRKNADQTVDSVEDVDTYLKRFIDFKLKVTEAERMGLDTMPSFVREFNSYREQLAAPYLTDRQTLEHLITEAYEHMKWEVNASHILIRCGMDAPPADTLDAYNRLMQIRAKITEGTPFSQMARAVSDDPSAKSNGGNLGYFTALQMVYPFEKAVYALKPGDLSMPVRTRFGYHLIYLHDRRPNPGSIHVAHIMVAVPRNADPQKKKEAFEKIRDIYRQLRNGASFDSLARKYSDDYNSARHGGILPWFGTGKMVPPFEKAAFALQHPGEISEPVQTGYGWHIIKLIERKPLQPLDEMKDELRRKILSSDRARIAREALVQKLISRYHIVTDSSLLEEIILNGSIVEGRFSTETNDYPDNRPVAQGDGFSLPVALLMRTLERTRANPDETTLHFVLKNYDNLLRDKIIEFEKSQLDKTNPDYAAILKEYHDGMLLFEIMDRKIWSRATRDTLGLEQFYTAHQKQYLSEKTQITTLYTFDNLKVQKQLLRDIKKMNRKKLSEKDLITKYHHKNTDLQIQTDTLRYSDQGLESIIPWKKGISEVIPIEGKYILVQTLKVIPPAPQPLDKIRGMVTADYQEYLENKWLEELHKKYKTTINRTVLSEIKNSI